MSILSNNISSANFERLQALSETGLPIDIINYCIKPFFHYKISVVIEIQKPSNLTFTKEKTTHKFTLDNFVELCKTKTALIQKIIDSNLATIKFEKNKYTYFTFHPGFNQFPLDYLKEVENHMEEHDVDDLTKYHYKAWADVPFMLSRSRQAFGR